MDCQLALSTRVALPPPRTPRGPPVSSPPYASWVYEQTLDQVIINAHSDLASILMPCLYSFSVTLFFSLTSPLVVLFFVCLFVVVVVVVVVVFVCVCVCRGRGLKALLRWKPQRNTSPKKEGIPQVRDRFTSLVQLVHKCHSGNISSEIHCLTNN